MTTTTNDMEHALGEMRKRAEEARTKGNETEASGIELQILLTKAWYDWLTTHWHSKAALQSIPMGLGSLFASVSYNFAKPDDMDDHVRCCGLLIKESAEAALGFVTDEEDEGFEVADAFPMATGGLN